MNKEHLKDDPSVDLILCKKILQHHFYERLDVVIACIEHKVSLEAFRAIERKEVMKHDNNMFRLSQQLTDHHNC